MWKSFIFIIIGIFLFAGCGTNEQIMLSNLKKSDWYKSQTLRAKEKDSHRSIGYIFAGQIKEIRYDYYQKAISDVVLSPCNCLYAPSSWAEWLSPNLVRLDANNDDFKDGYFPTVGEFWAFRVIKDGENKYKIKSAEKLIYDTNFSDVKK